MSKKVEIKKKELNALYRELEALKKKTTKLETEKASLIKANQKLLSYNNELINGCKGMSRDMSRINASIAIKGLSIGFGEDTTPTLAVTFGDNSTETVPSTGCDYVSMCNDIMSAVLLHIYTKEAVSDFFKLCDDASSSLCDTLESHGLCPECICCEGNCDCTEECDGECESCSARECPENPDYDENENADAPDGATE